MAQSSWGLPLARSDLLPVPAERGANAPTPDHDRRSLPGDRIDEKYKVVFVIDSLHQGGAERSLLDLIPAMGDLGIGTQVMVMDGSGSLGDLAQKRGIPVLTLHGTNDLSRLVDLVRELRHDRPDLIHTALFRSNLLGRCAGAITRTPVVTSLTGESFSPTGTSRLSRQARAAQRFFKAMDAWSSRHMTARLHAVSPATKDYHVRSYGLTPEEIVVVPRGRDGAAIRPATPEERLAARDFLGLDPSGLVLLHLGRQEPVKNIEILLEVLSSLRDELPHLVLLQAGRPGHSTQSLLNAAKAQGVTGRVHWLGHQEDVTPLLQAADLLVLPSLSEGMNGSIIEAMAAGLPVIASDIEANRYLVTDGVTGLLAPVDAVDAWTAAVRALQDASVRATYGRQARETFAREFTLKASARSMVDLHRAVLGERPWAR